MAFAGRRATHDFDDIAIDVSHIRPTNELLEDVERIVNFWTRGSRYFEEHSDMLALSIAEREVDELYQNLPPKLRKFSDLLVVRYMLLEPPY